MVNIDELFNLRGEVALVTGGNSGIGKAMAEGLAAAGAGIVIAARDKARNTQVVQELEDNYKIKAFSVKMDVGNEASVQAGVRQAVDKFGKITILINNAGFNIIRKAQEYTVEEWDSIMNVNLRGAFLCSKAVYPAMKANGGGRIINTGSLTSFVGSPKAPVYACSKMGILSLTYSLALAWVNDNIRVNAICPGWIDTHLTAFLKFDNPTMDRFIRERVPMGRWGKPADLIGTTIFLASHASDYITGEFIKVDGGLIGGLDSIEPYNQYQPQTR